MKISGKPIAMAMYEDLKERVQELKESGSTPHMAVILVGNNAGSIAYIAQKKQWGEYIGAEVSVFTYPEDVDIETLHDKLHALNDDPTVHGIILQRPLPKHINKEALAIETYPEKDIDGFHPNSKFSIPVALAVTHVLQRVFDADPSIPPIASYPSFVHWLQGSNVVVLGKGETAGSPIIEHLHKLGVQPFVVDSKTTDREQLLKEADVIISAVGKHVITKDMIKEGAVLVGVGIHTGDDGKIHGDYDKTDIESTAAFFTPTPGGIGPINVAYLLDNLVTAAENSN